MGFVLCTAWTGMYFYSHIKGLSHDLTHDIHISNALGPERKKKRHDLLYTSTGCLRMSHLQAWHTHWESRVQSANSATWLVLCTYMWYNESPARIAWFYTYGHESYTYMYTICVDIVMKPTTWHMRWVMKISRIQFCWTWHLWCIHRATYSCSKPIWRCLTFRSGN